MYFYGFTIYLQKKENMKNPSIYILSRLLNIYIKDDGEVYADAETQDLIQTWSNKKSEYKKMTHMGCLLDDIQWCIWDFSSIDWYTFVNYIWNVVMYTPIKSIFCGILSRLSQLWHVTR